MRVAFLIFFISFNLLAATYEIIVVTVKTGEKKSFIPTTKENFQVPLDVKGVNCFFNELKLDKQVIGAVNCASPDMSVMIKTFDDLPVSTLELSLPAKIKDEKTNKFVNIHKSAFTLTLFRRD